MRREEKAADDEAHRLLELRRPRAARATCLASKLPYGDQRRLEIARALATKPRLLLLDEPTAGMNPAETAEMTALIRRLRDDLGITILLIEHEMRVVMGISERITVLDYGQKIAEGTPARDPAATRASSRPTSGGSAPRPAGHDAAAAEPMASRRSGRRPSRRDGRRPSA